MEVTEYQKKAHAFAQYKAELYPVLGLVEEVGELVGPIAKHLRKNGLINWDSPDTELAKKIRGEVSDILWFCAEISTIYGWKLEDLMNENINKLTERSVSGCICGSGETVEERLANAEKEK